MESNLGVPVILLKNNQVLLARRKNVYGEGLYGLPGGHVDEQESLEHCVIRELREEVGVVPTEYCSLGLVKEWQKEHFFLHFVFLCTKWHGQITNSEPEKSEEWTWFPLGKLPTNLLAGHESGLSMLTLNNDVFRLIEI